ncbi:MAG: ABC transporter permease [Bradymonadia bacterium]
MNQRHTSSAVVTLRSVSKGFGGKTILDAVDLELHAGQITVVVGPSGGGKSVLLDLILGLLEPDAGSVRVSGRVGMVFQDGALFDDLTVGDNLAFPARRMAPEARNQLVNEAAEAVGLAPGHLAARPSQLSGGLRKRAAIARALVQGPPILLYDEPTAGLDAASGAKIGHAILAARAARAEQSALVVTHDYALVAQIADEVLYLDPEAHRLVPLFTAEALAELGEQTDPTRVRAVRDGLEAHFAAADPPPSEPGTAKPPLFGRFLGQLRQGVTGWGVLRGLRLPPLAAVMRRFWELGLTSIPAVAVSGLVLGLVSALQIGQALDGTLGDMDPLPALLGVVLCHHVGPLYTGLFLAGRVGARVASEVGVKTYLRQGDALDTFGVTPEAHWLSPMALAALLAFPLLAIILEAFGVLGGFLTYVGFYAQNTAGFEHTVLADVRWGPFALGLARAAVCGLVVVTLAFNAGRGARRGSDAVGRGTTRAVVSGLLGIILVELIFGLLSV